MRVLITGASGAIGFPLLARLCAEGTQVTALSRPGSREKVLRQVPERVVLGDVTQEFCGVPSDFIERNVGNFDVFLHVAARTKYHEEVTLLDNVAGTKNAIALAERLRIPKFVFVSTCYVGGTKEYLGENEVGDERLAQNFYERSKIRSEDLVRNFPGGYLIARLSTVIGDSKTGAIETVSGYSAFVYLVYTLRKRLLEFSQHPSLVRIDPESSLNLVTREWMVEMLTQAISEGATGTIHLSHPHPVNMGWLFEETFLRVLRLPVTCDVQKYTSLTPPENPRWRALQKLVGRAAEEFGPYVLHDTTYGTDTVSSMPWYEEPPAITPEIIRAQVDFLIRNFFTSPRVDEPA